MCDLGNKRVVRVGVGEHGADGQKNFGYRQSRTPLVSQNVQTDAAIGVDIGMVDSSGEVNLWWLEGIVCREVYGEEEDAALERAVTWTHDRSLPVKQIVSHRTGGE